MRRGRPTASRSTERRTVHSVAGCNSDQPPPESRAAGLSGRSGAWVPGLNVSVTMRSSSDLGGGATPRKSCRTLGLGGVNHQAISGRWSTLAEAGGRIWQAALLGPLGTIVEDDPVAMCLPHCLERCLVHLDTRKGVEMPDDRLFDLGRTIGREIRDQHPGDLAIFGLVLVLIVVTPTQEMASSSRANAELSCENG